MSNFGTISHEIEQLNDDTYVLLGGIGHTVRHRFTPPRCFLQSPPRSGRIARHITLETSRHGILANAQPCVNHQGSQSYCERSRWVIARFGFAPANRLCSLTTDSSRDFQPSTLMQNAKKTIEKNDDLHDISLRKNQTVSTVDWCTLILGCRTKNFMFYLDETPFNLHDVVFSKQSK